MAVELKKKLEELLQEEQLNDVNGGLPPSYIQERDGNVHPSSSMPV